MIQEVVSLRWALTTETIFFFFFYIWTSDCQSTTLSIVFEESYIGLCLFGAFLRANNTWCGNYSFWLLYFLQSGFNVPWVLSMNTEILVWLCWHQWQKWSKCFYSVGHKNVCVTLQSVLKPLRSLSNEAPQTQHPCLNFPVSEGAWGQRFKKVANVLTI